MTTCRIEPRLQIALLVALTAFACTPDFDDVSEAKDLRVLAIVADPPQIIVEPGFASPLPTISLFPLITDVAGAGRPIEVRIGLCGLDQTTNNRGRDRGPANFQDTLSRGRCGTEVRPLNLDRSDDLAAGVRATFSPSWEELARAAGLPPAALSAIDFAKVAPFGLPLRFQVYVKAGNDEVWAIKRVDLHPRLYEGQVANHNPVVSRIWARPKPDKKKGHPDVEPESPWRLLAATKRFFAVPRLFDPPVAGLITVEVGKKLSLLPEGDAAEMYRANELSRATNRVELSGLVREVVRYSFFATKGTFGPAQVDTEPNPLFNMPKVDLQTTYEAPRELPADSPDGLDVDLWLVARDERAGQSYLRGKLRVVPKGAGTP